MESIQSISGIRIGKLPVRYLGVPLVTRKLSETDCQPLVDKIQAMVRHWSANSLSFAGRLQRIRAVLFSISNYWCRQLILPKSVLQRINQLCSRFFWKGADTSASGARVSWMQICAVKSEGGLGLKDIQLEQSSFVSIDKKYSLWVAWVKAYVLKGEDYWQVVSKDAMSWSLRRLLKMRDEAARVFSWSLSLSVRKIWCEIRRAGTKVQWYPLHIPKHVYP